MTILWTALLAAAPALCPATGAEEGAVCAVLADQQAAWNRGDLNEFLATYEQNEQVTFAGKSGVTRGIQAVAERYRRTYGTRAAMGTLSFTLIEVRMVDRATALVLGRFALDREAAGGGPAAGYFSLVLRKAQGRWRILHDHTS